MDDCSDGDGDGKIFVGMGRGWDKFMGTDRDSLFYVQVAAWWRAQDRQNRARNCADSDAPARKPATDDDDDDETNPSATRTPMSCCCS